MNSIKFLLSLLLACSLVLSSCGNTKQDTSKPQNTTSEETTEAETTKAQPESSSESETYGSEDGGIAVDKNLLTVDITLLPASAELFGITDADVGETTAGNKIKKNSDGSYTITMTKARHKEMMAEIAKSINDGIQEMIDSPDYRFTDIKPNKDFTNFRITTTGNELNLQEMMTAMLFYIYSAMYNNINGKDVDNVHLEYVNENGEVIETADSGNLNEYLESLEDLGNNSAS